jgi:preprotein translocase subunit SecE
MGLIAYYTILVCVGLVLGILIHWGIDSLLDKIFQNNDKH